MAVRTEGVSFHSCDLCGEDRDETDLVRLYGPAQRGKRPQIDICPECQQHPIAEVVAWIRGKEQTTEPRPLRRIPGGNRIASP
jgi:hypothetical protein